LEGYIKTNFSESHNNKFNKIGCGSITDSIFKLEVHIINFSKDNYVQLIINKGDKIEITGVIQTGNKYLLLVISKIFKFIIFNIRYF